MRSHLAGTRLNGTPSAKTLCVQMGSSQRSVQFWSVSMANKSSIVSDLHGWRTPSVSGEEPGLPESPAHSRPESRGVPVQGAKHQRGFGPAVEPRRKSRPRSTHGSSKCQAPPCGGTGCRRAGGRRLSDRRLHAGTSASAPLFPRRGRPAGAESCTHLCEEPTNVSRRLAAVFGSPSDTMSGVATVHPQPQLHYME